MRHVILLDKKINNEEFLNWKADDTAFWQKYANITPQYWTIDFNFDDYPVELDWDNDARPTEAFMKALTDTVYNRYSADGTDFIMLFVHEDNWKSAGKKYEEFLTQNKVNIKKGIWGTAWAFKYKDYLTVYGRWDKRNPANNIGTMYHERCHPLDALIKVELGIDINPIIEKAIREKYKNDTYTINYLDRNGFNYDRDFVHGGLTPTLTYIRYKENTWVLEIIAPYVKQALKKREDRHLVYMGLQKTTITLAQKLIYLLRQKLYKKDGVSLD